MSQRRISTSGLARLSGTLALAALLVACSGKSPTTGTPVPGATPVGGGTPVVSVPATGDTPAPGATPAAGSTPLAGNTPAAAATPTDAAAASPEPDASGGTTTGGDIPDNAVFLTYADAAHAFSIQYVEGWQVTPNSDGVVVTDKDSSETVQVVPPVSDVKAYISGTDLPALQKTDGFRLVTQETVKVKGRQIDHLAYEQLSPPDPVTGKRLPSLVDRYYVPGPSGLAIVTLSTPTGVDNVDAFKQMIDSFTWK